MAVGGIDGRRRRKREDQDEPVCMHHNQPPLENERADAGRNG